MYFFMASEVARNDRQNTEKSVFIQHHILEQSRLMGFVYSEWGTFVGLASCGPKTQLGSFSAGEFTVWMGSRQTERDCD